MMASSHFVRETRFFLRQRLAVAAIAALTLLVVISLVLGAAEIARQQQAIEAARANDTTELQYALASASDVGGAAYAAFSLTWNPPSELAYLAVGQRDVSPWMLRVRALALEGQIHEGDNTNPEMSLSGRFDFSFVLAFLVPLFLIVLLYDLFSSERDAGRIALLASTSGNLNRLWRMRAVVVVVAVLLACLIPLWISGLVLGANAAALFLVTAVVLGTVLVWTALIALIASRQWSGALIASALVGIWCVLSLGIPLAGKYWIDSQVPRIDGAQISFIQRETVNGAWDQPKSVTMDAFYATHPQWAHSGPVTAPFHWKWYYAFQQVGDQAAADLSRQYREAIAQRDALTAAVAWISPPVAALRSMQQLASTDVASSLRYEQCIRDYHAQIRGFFYPLLFEETAFDSGLLQGFPRFDAATCAEDIRTNDP